MVCEFFARTPEVFFVLSKIAVKIDGSLFTFLFFYDRINWLSYLPVAQLDSASDSDSEGQRFESVRVGQNQRAGVFPCPLILVCSLDLSISSVCIKDEFY